MQTTSTMSVRPFLFFVCSSHFSCLFVLVTEVFEPLTPCRARKPALCGTARSCPMKGLQIRVWSWSWSSNSKYCAAVAVCAQLPQLIERSAFVRSRLYSSSSLEHDSPADSKIVAGAAILVENGPRATGSIARAVWTASIVCGRM